MAFVAAFLRAASGPNDDYPFHYPRVTISPDPTGNQYLWFVENERLQNRLALPDLAAGDALPILVK